MNRNKIRDLLTLLLLIITIAVNCLGWYGVANINDGFGIVLFGFFQLASTAGLLVALILNLTSLRKQYVSAGRRVVNLISLAVAALTGNGLSLFVCCTEILDDSEATAGNVFIVNSVIIILLIILNIKPRSRE